MDVEMLVLITSIIIFSKMQHSGKGRGDNVNTLTYKRVMLWHAIIPTFA